MTETTGTPRRPACRGSGRRRGRGVIALAGWLAALIATAAWGQGREIDELKAQFEERYPRLLQLQESGRVGETWNGLVAPVSTGTADASGDVAELVEAENRDRKKLYRLLAEDVRRDMDEDRGARITPRVIAERNAKRNFEKAGPTVPLAPGQGVWTTKQDRPWLPALLVMIQKGRVGETAEGYVEAVRDEHAKDARVAETVQRENDARRKLYERLAREQSLPAERIAGDHARRIARFAHIGTYVRSAGGDWAMVREQG